MLGALDRHFRENGAKFSILRDREFDRSRKLLNGKAIEVREVGLGKRKKRADALSEDDELLWRRGVLGDENPTILNHTIWFLLSQQFGTRGIQEHTQMYLEDLSL